MHTPTCFIVKLMNIILLFECHLISLTFFQRSKDRYRNDPKFSDRYAWANSADQDQEQSDQGLHCLQFRLHCSDSLPYGRAT